MEGSGTGMVTRWGQLGLGGRGMPKAWLSPQKRQALVTIIFEKNADTNGSKGEKVVVDPAEKAPLHFPPQRYFCGKGWPALRGLVVGVYIVRLLR
jgi:hypothetical protein